MPASPARALTGRGEKREREGLINLAPGRAGEAPAARGLAANCAFFNNRCRRERVEDARLALALQGVPGPYGPRDVFRVAWAREEVERVGVSVLAALRFSMESFGDRRYGDERSLPSLLFIF